MVRIPEMPPDETFPQLQVVTSLEPMREILQQDLPRFAHGELEIDRLKIKRFQYRPRKRCSICYQIEVVPPGGGEPEVQLMFGLLEGKGRARQRYEHERERISFVPPLVPAIHYLDELDMVLWGFPNDPQMKRLHELFDPELFEVAMEPYLAALAPAGTPCFESLETRIAKYVPASRCVLEHKIWSNPERMGEPVIHLYSKTYEDSRGAAIFDVMNQLWDSEARSSGMLAMPEALFYDDGLQTLFTRPVLGEHAKEQLGELDFVDLAPKIGQLLASIHTSGLSGLPFWPVEETVADVRKAHVFVGSSIAPARERMASIVEKVESGVSCTEGLPSVPLHGAFRLSQILHLDGRLVLLDFDGLHVGNPIGDVGSLAAHLFYLSAKGQLTRDQARKAIGSFCDAYREATPWDLPEDALRWYTAAEIAGKHAKKIVKRAKKNSDQKIEDLLGLAENVLDGKEPLG